jgi:DUF1680 family protein
MKKYLSVPAMLLPFATVLSPSAIAAITPAPYVVPAVVEDRQDMQIPDRVHLDVNSMLGARIQANTTARLLETVDVDRLLEGYRKRPGCMTWDGEHIGKWIHAASLAWANSGDEKLRAKIASAVTELIKCQEADGYLGTYLSNEQIAAAENQQPKSTTPQPKFIKRWTEWDVWSHKYNLLGLLTWVRLSGDPSAMDCCRKMGDLLCNTFGKEPGKLDFMKQGPFEGQVTVLEPMIMLYRMTGEPRYRDFCQYLIDCNAKKPHALVQTLLEQKRVDKVYAVHAYTMLSFMDGLLEWYRITGDKKLLTAAVNAWEDITARRRYITGAISYRETFHDDFDLPNNNHVGETCATVTWMQFNAQLLRLTGEARYAQEIERTAYNQLASAQSPDGKAWTYYVGLVGTKPYSTNFTGFCCLSSGPRGPVLLPTCALTTDGEGVVVNLYDQANAQLSLRDGTGVAVNLTTRFPSEPNIAIDIKPEKPADFAVKLRIPTWCSNATLKLGGKTLPMTVGEDGYVAVRRTWQAGDRLNLVLPPNARVVAGEHNNLGRAAICYGPLVLATDTALDPAGERIQLNSTDIGALSLTPEPAKGIFHDWSDAQVFRITSMGNSALLAPISTAGADKKSTCYRVWLPFTSQPGANLAVGGTESVSRTRTPPGAHVDQRAGGWGSIIDGGEVLTYNNTKQDEDWYAVTLAKPATVGRVVFIHSWAFPSGGWFDTSAGKPQVQVQTEKDGPWTTVGELKSYPATTATDAKVLGPHSSGTRYTCTLSKPVTALAVRVIGKPACGNDPKQSFSSCMGMEVYER